MASICVYGVLGLIAIFFIAPLLWLVLAAFEPAASVGSNAPLVLSFSNFAKVLNWNTTFKPLINSSILAGATSIITVAISLFAAYPLSRYQMRFRKPFLYTIVFSTGLPITAILVPVYAMFARFNLVDRDPGGDPFPGRHFAAIWDLAHEGLHGRGASRLGAGSVG